MARDESDREDLLREAVALTRRAEFTLCDESEPVFAGFKRDGSLSVYFGADPVFQFNPEGRLRRAYAGGFLFRTQGHTLARLERVRMETETILHRHDLSPEELGGFLSGMRADLDALRQKICERRFETVNQIPEDGDVIAAILAGIDAALSAEPPLAPAIPGRR